MSHRHTFSPVNSNGRQILASTALAIAVVAGSFATTPPAQAATEYKAPEVLRVCQDPNNLPFSNDQFEGIENKLAELFAQQLGVPVEYFSFPQRLAFVRNTIKYKLPGQDFRCDIMMGVPQRFGQVATTNAYYRSTYSLIYRKGEKLEVVIDNDSFIARAREALGAKRLGIHDKSPAAAFLNKHNLTSLAKLYQMMSPDPEAYPGQVIERDLVDGTIDAAIVWGPVAGFYGKKITDPALTVVPLTSEPGVRFDFAIAMGVRHGEPQWKNEVQRFINQSNPQITAILREFGVPLVSEIGDLIPPAQDPDVQKTPASAVQNAVPSAAALKAERDQQAAAAAVAAEKTKADATRLAADAARAEQLRVAKDRAAKEDEQKQAAAEKASTEVAANQNATAIQKSPQKATITQVAAGSASSSSGSNPLYTVRDGEFVDADTLAGFKTWRAAACDRCHGANQQGLVGPSLIESLKTLSKDDFIVTIRDGRLSKGMQSFGNSKKVMNNIDNLYAYLKGRSDGAITKAKVKLLN